MLPVLSHRLQISETSKNLFDSIFGFFFFFFSLIWYTAPLNQIMVLFRSVFFLHLGKFVVIKSSSDTLKCLPGIMASSMLTALGKDRNA